MTSKAIKCFRCVDVKNLMVKNSKTKPKIQLVYPLAPIEVEILAEIVTNSGKTDSKVSQAVRSKNNKPKTYLRFNLLITIQKREQRCITEIYPKLFGEPIVIMCFASMATNMII